MSTLSFDIPTTIRHGGGSIQELPSLVEQMKGERVFIVTDPGIVELGLIEPLVSNLESHGLKTCLFHEVQPDPTDENVLAGVEALQGFGADLIVTIGGGSAIDTAKVIGVVPSNPGPLSDFMGLHKIENKGLPLIAIPTTAGTGSEATKVAVITDTQSQTKMMMLSLPLMPSAVILDYELTMSMPKGLTAAVGVDTFTHALEAYVSKKANVLTDPIALSSAGLVAKHLVTAWNEPDNSAAREAMMLAACQGGMAFSNSSVCLVHGMSRPLGAVFHLPHGLSNAVLLPEVTRYSIAEKTERYAQVARHIGAAQKEDSDENASEKLVTWLGNLNDSLAIPRLRDCRGMERGLFEESLAKMANDALASGSPSNNPRVPSESDIIEIYNRAW